MMLEHSFAKAAEMGYEVIVIYGNPDNYVARGFKSCKKYNVCRQDNGYQFGIIQANNIKGGIKMLELPEVSARAAQIREHITGKTVSCVRPPSKEHKFCWYNGEPAAYHNALAGKKVTGAEGFGIFVEISFEDDIRLCVNDGVNMLLIPVSKASRNYQLLMEFSDGLALVFTVAMYGGIYLHKGDYDNEYYIKSRQAISPFAPEFQEYFSRRRTESKKTLSAKAFLATEQRFPGIGNGVLQDILFAARIHPKRKVETLSENEWVMLRDSVVSVLREMTDKGGRDTEKDIFGRPGGYQTKMSKMTYKSGCPCCGGSITKEAYMGGSVYYCPVCQPKEAE